MPWGLGGVGSRHFWQGRQSLTTCMPKGRFLTHYPSCGRGERIIHSQGQTHFSSRRAFFISSRSGSLESYFSSTFLVCYVLPSHLGPPGNFSHPSLIHVGDFSSSWELPGCSTHIFGLLCVFPHVGRYFLQFPGLGIHFW